MSEIILVLGIVGSIASLISVPLAMYFYKESRGVPKLTYHIHPVKAVLVRVGEGSKLQSRYEDKEITTDITAAQVAIWNRGKLPIRKSNILKSIVIRTDNNAPILEAIIRTSSREVIQLELDLREIQDGRVITSWNILEHNDGGVIQLIYAGNTDLNIVVEGVIEGQREIEKHEFSGKIQSPDEQYAASKYRYKGLGYSLLFFGALILILPILTVIPDIFRSGIKKLDWFQWMYLIVPGILSMFLILGGLYYSRMAPPQGPPFDF